MDGAACVVSALSGLREVIVDLQTKLLAAAISARVARFIPSDYCIDYTRLKPGTNRNLDFRREFNLIADRADIQVTSVLNGMFSDLLTDQAPIIISGLKKVIYWGNEDMKMDFTNIENTAEYTVLAALDKSTPRYLRIAGEVASAREIARAATEATGKKFDTMRIGGLGMFAAMIKIARTLFPQKDEVFPAWQGMQYLHNMYTGLPKLDPLDNQRYPEMSWTPLKVTLLGLK